LTAPPVFRELSVQVLMKIVSRHVARDPRQIDSRVLALGCMKLSRELRVVHVIRVFW
jgi:hypothetical protein